MWIYNRSNIKWGKAVTHIFSSSEQRNLCGRYPGKTIEGQFNESELCGKCLATQDRIMSEIHIRMRLNTRRRRQPSMK